MENVQIIILAAGKGTRMNSPLPKALINLAGKPFLGHILDKISHVGFTNKPIVVVSYKKEDVEKEFAGRCIFVEQIQPLGTANAVLATKDSISPETKTLLVLYTDHPLISEETIKNLIDKQIETKAKIVMGTAVLPDFEDWRVGFHSNFSRIIRNQIGQMTRSVEVKDATEEEKKILEVNPCYFAFDSKWLFEKLPQIDNNNAKGEYYLTDIIKIAGDEGLNIETIHLNPKEALGANSLEELALLERLIKE